jgi:hypothetical protein
MKRNDTRAAIFYGDDPDLRKDLCPKCFEIVSDYIDELHSDIEDRRLDSDIESLQHDLKYKGRRDQK